MNISKKSNADKDCLNIYENYLNNKTAGLLIEGNTIYSVTYSGQKKC